MVGARSLGKARDASAGEALRQARRRRRISLDQAGLALRIPPAQLKSLEEGNLSIFSAEVYARGAYRKYAQYLGVEREEVHRAFLRSLSDAREMVPLKVPRLPGRMARLLTPTGVVVLSLAVGVALVGSYLGWQVQTFVRLPELEVVEPTEVVIQDSAVVVRGRAEREAQVRVNGEEVLVGEDGTFAITVPLRVGINVIQATATGAADRTRVVERHLLVPRS
jgi:cytoskeletal protein RodZ